MPEESYPDVPPDFGHWLAGFIDGEGCLTICHSAGKKAYTCRLMLSLRMDDRPLLDHLMSATGLGFVKRKQVGPNSGRANEKPQATWQVHKKAELVRLVEILDTYPLRSKKARDYVIWREAVLLWASMRREYTGHPRGGRPYDWSRMAVLHDEIQAVRRYDDSAPTADSGHAGDDEPGRIRQEGLA